MDIFKRTLKEREQKAGLESIPEVPPPNNQHLKWSKQDSDPRLKNMDQKKKLLEKHSK